jgi:hypothetical protein
LNHESARRERTSSESQREPSPPPNRINFVNVSE